MRWRCCSRRSTAPPACMRRDHTPVTRAQRHRPRPWAANAVVPVVFPPSICIVVGSLPLFWPKASKRTARQKVRAMIETAAQRAEERVVVVAIGERARRVASGRWRKVICSACARSDRIIAASGLSVYGDRLREVARCLEPPVRRPSSSASVRISASERDICSAPSACAQTAAPRSRQLPRVPQLVPCHQTAFHVWARPARHASSASTAPSAGSTSAGSALLLAGGSLARNWRRTSTLNMNSLWRITSSRRCARDATAARSDAFRRARSNPDSGEPGGRSTVALSTT